jgi:hypothetical protein
MFLHINGVALYKTGSENLQLLISLLDEYIQHSVLWGFKVTPYDCMLTDMIISELNLNDLKNLRFWQRVYKNILKNTLIVNLSTLIDKVVTVGEVLKYHPKCEILHKKQH